MASDFGRLTDDCTLLTRFAHLRHRLTQVSSPFTGRIEWAMTRASWRGKPPLKKVAHAS